MHISLIDDEKLLRSNISKKLKSSGYLVSEYHGYHDFMQSWFFEDMSDLYIIDISLWDWSGYDIISELRTRKNITKPVIVISGFWEVDTKLFWFWLWIDDYITKPFSPEELIARVNAILRRCHQNSDQKELSYKWLSFHTLSNEFFVQGTPIHHLNKKEKDILIYFLRNSGKLIPKEHFIKLIWWCWSDVTQNTINVTLSKLRKKLWDNFPLQTIPHIWYILE